MSETEAGWSELPMELLNLISERLDNEIDLIRFRSVCSTWRSSTITNHYHILPFKLPLSKNNPSSWCYLSKCSHFLIRPSPQQQQEQTLVHRPWLIRIAKNSTGETKFLRSRLRLSYFHSTYLDFNKLSVIHLGTDFVIDEKPLHYDECIYPKKIVAVTPLILAILYNNDQLILLSHGDEHWTEIPDMLLSIGDICVFKGQLYAVEEVSSKLVTVAPEDLSVKLVAKEVRGRGGDIKFLVESDGELLLVDVYEPFFKIDVFRLDEKEKQWVKLPSLGDRILFVGNACCSFSTSASDLYVAKGNCVIFMDDVFDINMLLYECRMCVFHLDQGRLSPLCNYPDYSNLFWPTPRWIIEGCMHKEQSI